MLDPISDSLPRWILQKLLIVLILHPSRREYQVLQSDLVHVASQLVIATSVSTYMSYLVALTATRTKWSIYQSEVKPRAMPPPPPRGHRRKCQYQEMLDDGNPRKTQQERDAHFIERLPHVQLVSRGLQSHLEIFDPAVWPTPRLPDSEAEGNDYLVEINTKRVQDALDDCKDYAFKMDRDSSKGHFLDEAMRQSIHPQQAIVQAGGRAANATASRNGMRSMRIQSVSQVTPTSLTRRPLLKLRRTRRRRKRNKLRS